MRKILLSSTMVCLFLAAAAPSRADSPDPSRKEAADRFDRGIHMVDSGDLSGALAEFQRAYALVPAPVVIYNVGLVYAAMSRPVDAARALTKALATPDALKPDVAAHARDVLREQTEKIGQVGVTVNVAEGAVEIDNIEVAKLPLPGPLDVAAGPHVIGVISRGYAPGRKEVLVPAKARADVAIEVVPVEGLLGHIELHSHVPGVDVFIDGGRVGKTPLESSITVAPGAHTVTLKRAGYNDAERSVTLQDGARSELSLDPTIDKTALSQTGGYLTIRTSEDQATVMADGQDLGLLKGAIQLPAGPHRIHVERGGFIPAERDIEVPQGVTSSIDVVFEPTPETRADYVSGASSRRTWSWVTMGIGAALAGGGFGLGVAEGSQVSKDQAAYTTAFNNYMLNSSDPNCDTSGVLTPTQEAACQQKINDASNKKNSDQALQITGYIVGGVGAAALVTGFVMLVTGDDPHKYDEKPSEKLLGWQLMPTVGARGVSLSAAHDF